MQIPYPVSRPSQHHGERVFPVDDASNLPVFTMYICTKSAIDSALRRRMSGSHCSEVAESSLSMLPKLCTRVVLCLRDLRSFRLLRKARMRVIVRALSPMTANPRPIPLSLW